MIINITDKCLMVCSHCSESCTPYGEHTTMDVFKDTLKIVSKLNPMVILVTGGEPTLHPSFLEIMLEIKRRFKPIERICITSNGMFLEDKEYTEKILDLGIQIQITNDPRYYPKKIPIINHPNLIYTHHIPSLLSIGRAKDNNMENVNTIAPKCFNLRSIAQNVNQLSTIIKTLELNGKFCVPSIDIKGNIKPGEFNICNSIGTIYDNPLTIVHNILKFKCNNCGMMDKLSPIHRAIIEKE